MQGTSNHGVRPTVPSGDKRSICPSFPVLIGRDWQDIWSIVVHGWLCSRNTGPFCQLRSPVLQGCCCGEPSQAGNRAALTALLPGLTGNRAGATAVMMLGGSTGWRRLRGQPVPGFRVYLGHVPCIMLSQNDVQHTLRAWHVPCIMLS